MRNKEKQLRHRDVQDVLDVISGTWRGAILASLCDKEKRFNLLKRDLEGITSRTLIRELKHLELNKLIIREERQAIVFYKITSHGKSLEPVIESIQLWAKQHRKLIVGK